MSSHAGLVPGIPPLGRIRAVGNLRGGYSDTPGQDLSSCVIAAMLFQGTPPLAEGMATSDDSDGGLWRMRGAVRPAGGEVELLCSNTQLATLIDGGALVITKACFVWGSLFAGQETRQVLRRPQFTQRGVSCEVETIHAWVAVVIKTA